MRIKDSGQVVYQRRYRFDPDKYTSYGTDGLEAYENLYKEEVDIGASREVWLSSRGGKNPRKRRHLGRIWFFYQRDGNRLLLPPELQQLKQADVTTTLDHYVSYQRTICPSSSWGSYTRTYQTNKEHRVVFLVKTDEQYEQLSKMFPQLLPPKEIEL